MKNRSVCCEIISECFPVLDQGLLTKDFLSVLGVPVGSKFTDILRVRVKLHLHSNLVA